MAIRLDTRSSDFAGKFRAFLDTKRETAADVEAAVRDIIADVMARGDRGAEGADAEIRSARSRPRAAPGAPGKRSPRRAAPARRGAGRARIARDRIEGFIVARCRRTIASPMRSASNSARAGRRSRRSVSSAGRHRRLSVLGADERGARQGRRRAADRDGGAGAATAQLNPLVLAAAKLAGVDEIYRDRRRAGSRGAGLRHRDHAPVAKIVGPATPMWPRPSAWCSARSASNDRRAPPRC